MEKIVDEIIETNDSLAVSDEKKELNLFRTMYYQLNAKPDSVTKVFSRQIILKREDIIDLNNRIKDKISMHCQEDDGYIATLIVSLSNRKTIEFACWEEFVSYQWNETAHIKSVILKWSFNVRMPQYKLPQNHVLTVKISSGLRPEEMLNLIFSGNMEDFEAIDTNSFPVIARVDFIESLLGDELLNVVSNWVKGLKRNYNDRNPFIMLMRKYRKKVAYYFNYGVFAMLLLLCTVILNKILYSFNIKTVGALTIEQLALMLNVTVGMFIVLGLSLKILEKIANRVYDALEKYGNGFVFSITRGDIQKQEDIQQNDKKSGKRIIVKLIFSLIFNVLCGIISTILV